MAAFIYLILKACLNSFLYACMCMPWGPEKSRGQLWELIVHSHQVGPRSQGVRLGGRCHPLSPLTGPSLESFILFNLQGGMRGVGRGVVVSSSFHFASDLAATHRALSMQAYRFASHNLPSFGCNFSRAFNFPSVSARSGKWATARGSPEPVHPTAALSL